MMPEANEGASSSSDFDHDGYEPEDGPEVQNQSVMQNMEA
jgi:hypothetical protein